MSKLNKEEGDQHRKYYNDNREIPSCTTIVGMLGKSELVKWANYMGFKKINTTSLLEEKAAYGTFCHKLFEIYFNGGLITANSNTDYISNKEFREIIYKFYMVDLYFNKLGIRVVDTELSIEGNDYGGTMDLLCYNEKRDCLMIFDLKTSKAVYQSHWIQIMGYVQLLKEKYDLDVEEVGVILLSKPLRSPELINVKSTKECWRELAVFNKLKDAYYILNEPEDVVKTVLKDINIP